jgi:hypothetical protein
MEAELLQELYTEQAQEAKHRIRDSKRADSVVGWLELHRTHLGADSIPNE